MPLPEPPTVAGRPIVHVDTSIRPRYAETDQGGIVHHSNYLVYFEIGRTELLRSLGVRYRDVEEAGLHVVIVKATLHFRRPAFYDDALVLRTMLHRTTPVRLEHRYELYRDGALLTGGETTLACVDRDGLLQPIPPALQVDGSG